MALSPPKSRLLKAPKRSFFLFGPRGVGKSTWLTQNIVAQKKIDLLHQQTLLSLTRNPSHLEDLIGDLPKGSWVSLDEVQKVPALLDEVHRLLESKHLNFALSGSSARKLRRGGANLLAGRALTLNMESFSVAELNFSCVLKDAMEWGLLPLIVLQPEYRKETLDSYVHTYIKEEIREEGLLRKVEPFLRFLEVAALMNGNQLNSSNIAREAEIARTSVDNYFSILVDTLIGHFLPCYRPQAKVREKNHPKFYWFDPGVARAAAGLLSDPPGGDWLGTALETLIFHELRVYNQLSGKTRALSYYRTKSDVEIDFIIETRKRTPSNKGEIVCIEVKHSKKWDPKWERAMRDLAKEKSLHVKAMYGIYLGTETYSHSSVQVMPVMEFLRNLHDGKIF